MNKLEQIIKQLCILVVDDMDSIRNIVNSRLKGLGAEQVIMTGNGESAWDTLNNKQIDLIISDWDMPELNGLELLGRVRNSESHSHIPFLMLSDEVAKEKVVRAVEAGADDYLVKPFQPKELEVRVIKMLAKIKPK